MKDWANSKWATLVYGDDVLNAWTMFDPLLDPVL
jgi:hypothetical protein